MLLRVQQTLFFRLRSSRDFRAVRLPASAHHDRSMRSRTGLVEKQGIDSRTQGSWHSPALRTPQVRTILCTWQPESVLPTAIVCEERIHDVIPTKKALHLFNPALSCAWIDLAENKASILAKGLRRSMQRDVTRAQRAAVPVQCHHRTIKSIRRRRQQNSTTTTTTTNVTCATAHRSAQEELCTADRID